MKSLIHFKEGRDFLEQHAWEIAMATLHEDFAFAVHFLDQMDDEVDRAYCRGVAYCFWASMAENQASEEGVIVPDGHSHLLH